MQEEKIAELLYSSKTYRIVSSFFNELPECEFDAELVQWHKQHKEQHQRREILMGITGCVTQYFKDNFYQIRPQCVLLVDYHEKHTFGYSKRSRGFNCWISLQSGCFSWHLLSCENGSYIHKQYGVLPHRELFTALENCWDSFTPEISDQEKNALLTELRCLLKLLMVYISRQITNRLNNQWQTNKDFARAAIMQAVKHIDEHCDCTVSDLALMAGYSQVHFGRLFRRFIGMRPKDYINVARQRKYTEAKAKVSVKQLAAMLGFSSSAALAHWLKQNRSDRSKPIRNE